ncbi:MAG: DNA polymerase III subunit gamma/tau [Cyanobacteria bacterium P01_F01_bin.53]
MYEPLHHKYRPQTFAQLVGQGAISDTLTHALQQNRIAPAYLFCGPRGTGKTSSARILAKSLNCLKVDAPTPEPCGECDVCKSVSLGNALDIVEIDAASNTGVDNIRELIERAQFAPVQCRYKLFVLDEVHMLSTAAFNALLKTLEEPPDRVVFVLATTDPQRVLPTIISRCQRFDFRRIPLPAMIRHLSYIATEESINIAESAVQLVAQISQGGLRDAESLLDQLSLQADEITVETVWDLVGAVPERDLLNLVRAIVADDGPALLERVRHLMDKGREPLIVLQSLVGFYRDLLIAKSAPARADLVAITPPTWEEMTTFAQSLSAAQLLAGQQKLQTSEVQVKNTTQPRLWLEITLTGLLPSALGTAANLTRGAVASAGNAAARAVLSVANLPAMSRPAPATPAVSTPVAPSNSVGVSDPPPAQSTPVSSGQPKVSPAPASAQPSASSAPSAPTELPVSRSESVTVPAEPPTTDAQTSEPPSSPAATPVPDVAAPATEVAFGSLDELWAKILAVLEPRGTQMLMNQQGTLLAFDGVGAKVGFRSASLQKMAQQRVPNLEAAFESVFQRPIRVSLEVAAPNTNKENKDSAPPAPSASPAAGSSVLQKQSVLPSVSPNPISNGNVTSSAGAADASQRQAPAAPVPKAQSLSVSSAPAPPQPPATTKTDRLPSAPSAAGSSAGDWQNNQEQDNIKRFAQFFNGQIVNLDDDLDNISVKGASGKSSDPGPDVPF